MTAQTTPVNAENYLSINNIEVIYDHVILVLKGVSLNVPKGKIVALLGANGAGKSTTLKAISNLLHAERGDVTKGSVEYKGPRVDQLTPNELVQRGVFQVMEGRHCFGHLTIEENLLTGAYTRSISRAELKDSLEKVYHYFPRLKTRRTSQAGYTSGGEQQMCAIGRALMANPEMVLLDEPSMGLAPQIVEEVFEIVQDLNSRENISFLLAEQNTMVALKNADFGYILENGRVLYAAGFRHGDLVHNCFSYHFTPGAFLMEGGARQLGCTVCPGGVGQTEQQVQAMADLRPDGYDGTPSFLRIIVEKAEELGADISSLKKALVSGEALPGVTRAWLAERGIRVSQCYATADIGAIAYETEAQEGLVVEEELLVEIVRPGTGDPVAEGEVGEVVVTSFSPDYPLIRFATGDLSAFMPGRSPCGRTNVRLRGWMGRADQTTKVKGMFVHPEQIADIARRHPEIARMRLVVDNPGGQDRMVLHCEIAAGNEALAKGLIDSLREITKLRGEVAFVAQGGLPNDGKVIEDSRVY